MAEDALRAALAEAYGVGDHMGEFLIDAFEAQRLGAEQAATTATGMIRLYREWRTTRPSP